MDLRRQIHATGAPPCTPPASSLSVPKPSLLRRSSSANSLSSLASDTGRELPEPLWTSDLDSKLRSITEHVLLEVANTGTPFTGTPPPQIVHVIARAAHKDPTWPASLSSTRSRVRHLFRSTSSTPEERPHRRQRADHDVDATPKRRRTGGKRAYRHRSASHSCKQPQTLAALCLKLHRLQPSNFESTINSSSSHTGRRRAATEPTTDYFSIPSLSSLRIADDTEDIKHHDEEVGLTDGSSAESTEIDSDEMDARDEPGKRNRCLQRRNRPTPLILSTDYTSSSNTTPSGQHLAVHPSSSDYRIPSPIDPSLVSSPTYPSRPSLLVIPPSTITATDTSLQSPFAEAFAA